VTPYAWWVSKFWLWPLWVFGIFVLVATALLVRKNKREIIFSL
jgi:hypothetical protein